MARRTRREPERVPTIGELMRNPPRWVWATCDKIGCGHRAPLAIAPFAIRWGLDVSSDVLRRSLRCTGCGAKGHRTMHPSWGDSQRGWQSFPRPDPDDPG